jgi:hypothetical protein
MRQYWPRAAAQNRNHVRGTTQMLARLLVSVLHGHCKVISGTRHPTDFLDLHVPSASQLSPHTIRGPHASNSTRP